MEEEGAGASVFCSGCPSVTLEDTPIETSTVASEGAGRKGSVGETLESGGEELMNDSNRARGRRQR